MTWNHQGLLRVPFQLETLAVKLVATFLLPFIETTDSCPLYEMLTSVLSPHDCPEIPFDNSINILNSSESFASSSAYRAASKIAEKTSDGGVSIIARSQRIAHRANSRMLNIKTAVQL